MAGDSGSLKSQVQAYIGNNKVMVFSKSYCPYCNKVKELFKSLGIDFLALELDQVEHGSEIQAALAELTSQKSVPNVFINGQHVGGCDKTHELHSQGRLLPLIRGE